MDGSGTDFNIPHSQGLSACCPTSTSIRVDTKHWQEGCQGPSEVFEQTYDCIVK